MLIFAVKGDDPRFLVGNGYGNFNGISGKELFNKFWPLHETIVSTVEILVDPEVEYLCCLFYPVKVEVVNGPREGGDIFVHNGEGWACHCIPATQLFAKRLNEGCLSGAHSAIKGKYPFSGGLFK